MSTYEPVDHVVRLYYARKQYSLASHLLSIARSNGLHLPEAYARLYRALDQLHQSQEALCLQLARAIRHEAKLRSHPTRGVKINYRRPRDVDEDRLGWGLERSA